VSEKHWKKLGQKHYDAHDIMLEGSRNQIIRHIEEEDLEEKVRDTVAKVWAEIDEATKPKRKRRYQ